MAKIISLSFVNLVRTDAGAKNELFALIMPSEVVLSKQARQLQLVPEHSS
jgi:hypothetical protein